jgi:hypothetical protein
MAVPFFTPRARFFDADGNPLSGGSVGFYVTGTPTLKEVYTTSDESVEAQNPHTLDGEGYVREGGVWLGQGDYKIVLKDSDEVELWTCDTTGADVASGIESSASVESIADLRDLDTDKYGLAYVTGYYASNDGGQGWFYWVSTSGASDNGGTIVAPTGSPANGRWIRIVGSEEITPHMFGATNNTAFSVNSNITNMIAWAKATTGNTKIRIPSGKYYVDGSATFDGDILLEIEEGANFDSHEVSGTITIDCPAVINSLTPIITDYTYLTLVFSTEMDLRPEWWGAVGDNATDDYSAFARMSDTVGVGGNRVLLNGIYQFQANAGTADVNLGVIVKETSTAYINFIKDDVSYFVDRVVNDFNTYCFTGVGIAEMRFDEREVKLSWFNVGNITTSLYTDVVIAVTANYTQQGTIVWDRAITYTFDANYTLSDASNFFLTNKIERGAIIDTGGNDIYLGQIVASRRQVFDKDSNLVQLTNGSVPPEWWGADYGTTNASNNSTSFASACADNREVDLGGATFYLEGVVAQTNINLRNGTIINSSSQVAHTLLDASSSIDLRNVYIQHQYDIVDAPLVTAVNSQLRTTVTNYFPINGNCVRVELKGCDLIGFTLSTNISVASVAYFKMEDSTLTYNSASADVEIGFPEIAFGSDGVTLKLTNNLFDISQSAFTTTLKFGKTGVDTRCIVANNMFDGSWELDCQDKTESLMIGNSGGVLTLEGFDSTITNNRGDAGSTYTGTGSTSVVANNTP